MMKKILYFFMAATLLCSCEKEDNGGDSVCPVTEISMPASSTENPIIPGSSVTIQGKGFTSGSEIWFRSMTKSTDVQATVTGVTASAITFTAPEVYGSQSVLLKQDGTEWTLGTLVFEEDPTNSGGDGEVEILPRKIVKSVFIDEESEYTSLYSYDTDGRLTKIETTSGTYSDVLEIAYTQDKVTAQYKELDSDFQSSATFSLANGRANHCLEGEPGTQWETDYTYDNNGYMTGITFSVEEGFGTDTYDGTLTIGEEGALEHYAVTEKEIECGENYGPYSIAFTPNKSVLNNLNLDLLGSGDFLEEIDEQALSYAYLLNIGGTRTKYLPQEIMLTDVEGYSYTVTYNYEFDGDYLSKIRIMSDNGTFSMNLYYEE